MVHACLLFWIGFMVSVSALKNVEWVQKKVVWIKAWWAARQVEKQANDPVLTHLRLVTS